MFGLTLALGLALPGVLAAIAHDAPDRRAAGGLFLLATVAFTLQLIPLRRRFFLEVSAGRLVTGTTDAGVPLSSVRRISLLARTVVRQGNHGITTRTWHELWLHLGGDTRLQLGSRMESEEAAFLSEQLHLRVPGAACTSDGTLEDLPEPRAWMSQAGPLLAVALTVTFFFFLTAAEARQSPIAHRALALAAADAAVSQLLGAPLAWGLTASVSNPRPSAARLSGEVSGPQGAGTLHADGYFKDGEWCFAQLEVQTSRGALPVKQPACRLTPFERDAVYYVPPSSGE